MHCGFVHADAQDEAQGGAQGGDPATQDQGQGYTQDQGQGYTQDQGHTQATQATQSIQG